MELPLSYLKEIASQLVFISVFLGGFSASLLGTLIISKTDNKIIKTLIVGTSLSAVSFIVAVFAMTKIVMLATPGYPFEVNEADTVFPRTVGVIAFFIGIFSLIFVVAASGWLHSKRLGYFTTMLGVIAFILILLAS